jgi:hypothetical protein
LLGILSNKREETIDATANAKRTQKRSSEKSRRTRVRHHGEANVADKFNAPNFLAGVAGAGVMTRKTVPVSLREKLTTSFGVIVPATSVRTRRIR